MIQPLFWKNNRLTIVDQRRLPFEYNELEIRDHYEMAEAIKELVIRGAPAIGIAAAFGLVLGLKSYREADRKAFLRKLDEIAEYLFNTRPTAVNLGWALERLRKTARKSAETQASRIWSELLKEAQQIHHEDIAMCRQIAEKGQALIPPKANIITHCNTGGLATGGLGTALGILITAHQQGKQIHVYVDETRPLLQGARLTAWELSQEQVPFTIISDNMAAYIMAIQKIDAVIVGADRIAANGDTANKIGTYGLAVLAGHHRIPFYVAAPSSTIDSSIRSGRQITIEERDGAEVKTIFGKEVLPPAYPAISPAFDVTPCDLITAIVTEKGIQRPTYRFE